MGWERSDGARELSAHWRVSVSQETYLRFLDQFRWPTVDDAAALRGALASPVLVVARRHKYLTRRIPTLSACWTHATLLPGEDALPYDGDTERVIETIRPFVEIEVVPEAPSAQVVTKPLTPWKAVTSPIASAQSLTSLPWARVTARSLTSW
jgi:hypothetical protein